MEFPRRPIDSLTTLCIDYLVKHLEIHVKELETIKMLPSHIKDRLLHKFTSSSVFWTNVPFNKIIQTLIHPTTKRIDLSLATADDETLEALKQSHHLRDVYLTGNINVQLSNEALLNFVSSLNQLYLLQMPYCLAVDDDILISLSKTCPMLAGLDVNGCIYVTDKSLQSMAPMTNLQWLTFSATQVSNEGIKKLTSGPSGKCIKELRLANCKQMTIDVLHAIIEYCPNIEVLAFYNLRRNENNQELYASLQSETLKNLKQLTWTIQW